MVREVNVQTMNHIVAILVILQDCSCEGVLIAKRAGKQLKFRVSQDKHFSGRSRQERGGGPSRDKG